MPTDWELLDIYATRKDNAAFAELVRRHVGLVYHIARRTVGPTDADDVTQSVFVLLSEKAGRIRRRGVLAGWLFGATRYCCANLMKIQRRRRTHEREAAMTPSQTASAPEATSDVGELLDDALASLSDRERHAILLHYMEQRPVTEVAGELAITDSALEKRLQRGLAHLREFFSRRDRVIPATAIGALLAAEAVKASPAALAASIIAATPAPAAVLLIAKGASAMMTMQTVKVAVGIVLVAAAAASAITLTAGAIMQSHPSTGPTITSARRGLPRPMLVRLDTVMTGGGMARIRTMGTLAPAGQSYSSIVVDSEQLRSALAASQAAGELPVTHDRIISPSFNDYPQAFTGQPDLRLGSDRLFRQVRVNATTFANIDVGMIQNITADPRADAIRLRIADVPHTQFARDRATNDISGGTMVSLSYAGDIPVGQSAAFAAELGTVDGVQLFHVSIWQSFAATDSQWKYMQANGVSSWIQAPLAARLHEASRAVAWNDAPRHPLEQVMPEFERKLPGGSILRLVAVGDDLRWPYCYWDALGLPVELYAIEAYSGHDPNSGGLSVVIQSDDPLDASNKRRLTVATVQRRGAIDVGVGSGPWTETGNVAVGQTLEFEGLRFKLIKATGASPRSATNEGMTWVEALQSHPADRETEIFGVNKAGVRSASSSPRIRLSRQGPSDEISETITVQMGIADIDHFVVRWRKREWARFADFAADPQVTPDELLAKVSGTPAPAPVAVKKPLADQPEAFQDKMIALAKTHDVAKVRALMEAHGTLEESVADMMAEQFTATQVLRDALDARFKPEEVDSAFVNGGLLPRFGTAKGVVWQVNGDRAMQVSTHPDVQMTSGPGGSLVRVSGVWKMDMVLPQPLSPEQQQQLETALPQVLKTAAAQRAFAREVDAGRYKDVFDARDALRERLRAISN